MRIRAWEQENEAPTPVIVVELAERVVDNTGEYEVVTWFDTPAYINPVVLVELVASNLVRFEHYMATRPGRAI